MSYLVMQVAFMPLYEHLWGIARRKAATLFTLIVFIGDTLLCGIKRGFVPLGLACALAGVGRGGLVSRTTIATPNGVTLTAQGT